MLPTGVYASQDGWQTSSTCDIAAATKIATCYGAPNAQSQAGTVEVRYTNVADPTSHQQFTDYAAVQLLDNTEAQLIFSEAGDTDFPSLAGGLVAGTIQIVSVEDQKDPGRFDRLTLL